MVVFKTEGLLKSKLEILKIYSDDYPIYVESMQYKTLPLALDLFSYSSTSDLQPSTAIANQLPGH